MTPAVPAAHSGALLVPPAWQHDQALQIPAGRWLFSFHRPHGAAELSGLYLQHRCCECGKADGHHPGCVAGGALLTCRPSPDWQPRLPQPCNMWHVLCLPLHLQV